MKLTDFDKLSKKFPKVPEIQGRQDFFNSAVIVPFIEINQSIHLLFEKRAVNIRQPREICFPGGKHDPDTDDSYQETAIRETIEEVGIQKNQIKILGRLNTLITPMGVIVETFPALIKIRSLSELAINHNEVEKVFTVPVAQFQEADPEQYHVRVEIQPTIHDQHGKPQSLFPAQELGLPEKYHQPWGGNKMRILVYKTEFEIIWGLTAEIIYNLIHLLNKK
jgi:peroxisomal coenzyme A diphosphatase NUDT7